MAVPAQVNAGVTKHFSAKENVPDNSAILEKLCESVRADVYRLCMSSGSNACSKALTAAADKMSAEELLEFKSTLEKERKSKVISQLGMNNSDYSEFRMEGK